MSLLHAGMKKYEFKGKQFHEECFCCKVSSANRREDVHPTWPGGGLCPMLRGAVCTAMCQVQRGNTISL